MLDEAEFYIQKPSKSTAEIVWTILKETEEGDVEPGDGSGPSGGMISDTGRFKRATLDLSGRRPSCWKQADLIMKRRCKPICSQDLSRGWPFSSRIQIKDRTPGNGWSQARRSTPSRAPRLWPWWIWRNVAFAAGRHGDRVRISARSSRAAVRMD